jgi:hypothetical protein
MFMARVEVEVDDVDAMKQMKWTKRIMMARAVKVVRTWDLV